MCNTTSDTLAVNTYHFESYRYPVPWLATLLAVISYYSTAYNTTRDTTPACRCLSLLLVAWAHAVTASNPPAWLTGLLVTIPYHTYHTPSDRAVSSGTSNRNASTSRSPRSTPKGRSERLGGSHNPSYGEEDGRHVSTARDYRSGSDDDDSRRSRRRTSKDRDRRAARRKVDSEMDLALLGDNDGGDDDTSNAVERKPSRLIPSSPVVTEGLSPTLSGASVNGRHQLGDAVQARFGGRSRWFAGKVSACLQKYRPSLNFFTGEKTHTKRKSSFPPKMWVQF